MKNYFFLFLALTFMSSHLFAESCFPLYTAEAERLTEEHKALNEAMAHLETLGNTNATHSLTSSNKDNWAKNLVEAILLGPDSIPRLSSARSEWLVGCQKAIKKHCKLPSDNFATIRSMLSELMEDGSFCPNNKILKPKFLKYKAAFKDVLVKAVKDQRFAEKCRNKAVSDDSFREIKESSPPTILDSKPKINTAIKQ